MLSVEQLDAYYGDSHIIHGATLRSHAGGAAVLGRNGAGKSTLLKSIMGAGPRVSGRIVFEGKPIMTLPVHQRVRLGLSLVPEDRRIFPHITVEENLDMARTSASPSAEPHPVDWAYRAFPMLEPLKDRLGYQLSGGQQQLLAVARGLIGRPKLLLLDEPTEGLAPVIVEQLAERVSSIIRQEATGLLLAEQNTWFARQCTAHVYVIDAGVIVFSGSWAEFDARSDIRERYLGL